MRQIKLQIKTIELKVKNEEIYSLFVNSLISDEENHEVSSIVQYHEEHCKKYCTKYIWDTNIFVSCTNILKAKFIFLIILPILDQSTYYFDKCTNI